MDKIYCGSGKTFAGPYGDFEKVSICLDDIPNEHITKANNGKRYVNINISKKKETDQYGKNLSVIVDTWRPNTESHNPPQAHASKQEYANSNYASMPPTKDELPF
jgi:hypothetical protein